MNHVKENTETISIVDDTPANLAAMVEYLTEVGLRTMVARTGEAGLQLARREQPDLILLDVMLPGMDGFEVCRQLKADERTRAIPVIFMTAVLHAGCDDYLRKPFREAELFALLSKHLGVRFIYEEGAQEAGSKEQGAGSSTERVDAGDGGGVVGEMAGNLEAGGRGS